MDASWLNNPWVVTIGSGLILIIFEEVVEIYKEKNTTWRQKGTKQKSGFRVSNEQVFVAFSI